MKALAFRRRDAAPLDRKQPSKWVHVATLVVMILLIAVPTALLWPANQPARALGSIGPWSPDFNNQNMDFVVSNTAAVTILSTQVLIYFNDPGAHTVDVLSAGTPLADRNADIDSFGGGNVAVTDFGIYAGAGFSTLVGATQTAMRDTTTQTFAIPAGALTFDPDTGHYIAMLKAVIYGSVGSLQNGFKVKLPGAVGDFVGYDSNLPATSFGLDEASTSLPHHYTPYNVKFGANCNVTKATTATISWFDADNGNASAQPKKVGFELYGKLRGAAVFTRQRLTLTSAADGSVPGGAGTIIPGGNDGIGGAATFTAFPDWQYEWRWDLVQGGVYDNNTIQLGIPYDSVFYDTGCAKNSYNLVGSILPTPAYQLAGKTVDFNTSILNNGKLPSPAGTVTDTITYNAVSSTPGVLAAPVSFAGVQPAIPVGGSGTPRVLTATIRATALPGAQLCFDYTISPSTGSGSVNVSTICATVVALTTPTLVGNNGDVHAGGGTESCNTAGGIVTNDKSYGQYVVSTNGTIGGFGSNANVPLPGMTASIQNYTSVVCRPDLYAAWTAYAAPPVNPKLIKTLLNGATISIASFTASNPPNPSDGTAETVYYTNHSVHLAGGTLGTNKTTLVVNGTLTIDSSILSNPGSFDAGHQPSLGIIARDGIVIMGAATQVDAYLFTNGPLDTCFESTSPAPLHFVNLCANTLTVNGFIMANSFALHRFGPQPLLGGETPGEVINLLPQIYLNPPVLFGNLSTANITQNQGERPPLQ